LAVSAYTPYPNTYNEADAIEFAHIASMNYCPIDEIENWTCGYNCDFLVGYSVFYVVEVAVLKNETFSFSMLYNSAKSRFVVSFRGTQGNIELAIETMESIVPVEYSIHDVPNAWIDNYFQKQYVGELRNLLITQLQNALVQFPSYQFFFTGHSLGAALTTIAAHDMITSGYITAG